MVEGNMHKRWTVIAGGVLFDSTEQYLIPFVFAGTLCFIAAATSVVVWSLGKSHLKEIADTSKMADGG